MGLFSGDGKKVKKVKQKGKPKRSLRNSQTIETVVEVKTVGDIPPMLEARRLISDNKIAAAAAVAYNAARSDYARYYGSKTSWNNGERNFLIGEIESFKVKVPDIARVDGTSILEAAESVQPENDQTKARLSALKKLILLYLNYYEKSRFGPSVEFGGDELLERFSDVYNYVDIMPLYFSDSASPSRESGK
ncbi:MAG TPA: hypothetical protein VKU79_05165 [Thermoplasmataceae archaeon]|nr:hypothetical protein [Thermoplasmatales archaeon AK]HLH86235.1 hypothetical protein [Thermoplasmataceae archaeon]